mmetsp:Transcript_23675/g.40921  ORF Transcript_23675/g.40921 Transcript_23675/m.40921 type:complete len:223 (+) Transcript_23675:1154-1822(+)
MSRNAGGDATPRSTATRVPTLTRNGLCGGLMLKPLTLPPPPHPTNLSTLPQREHSSGCPSMLPTEVQKFQHRAHFVPSACATATVPNSNSTWYSLAAGASTMCTADVMNTYRKRSTSFAALFIRSSCALRAGSVMCSSTCASSPLPMRPAVRAFSSAMLTASQTWRICSHTSTSRVGGMSHSVIQPLWNTLLGSSGFRMACQASSAVWHRMGAIKRTMFCRM